MAQAARDQLAAESEAKRKTLEDELAAKLAEAERQIGATRAQAMTNVSEIAREAAAAIVERLGGRPADPAAVAAAVASVKTASGDA
jgi:F-type H+-transporting ATPase subunit b